MKRLSKITIIPITVLIASGLLYLLINFAMATGSFQYPHGNYTGDTVKCGYCHSGHEAGSYGLLKYNTQRETCYVCHDGSNSSFNVKSQFGETTIGSSVYSSYHPVPTGDQYCTTCHDPHLASGETPRLLSVGASKVSSGNAVCGECHGSGTALESGDMLTPITGTSHDSALTNPSSGTQIKCARCHQPHGSPYKYLIRQNIDDQSNISHIVTGNNNSVCSSCHTSGIRNFPGMNVYNATKHGSKPASTVALTVYPGTEYTGTMCLNCHEPHGKTEIADYKRVAGNDLCVKCHDDASIILPAAYSYRGIDAYKNTLHAVSPSMPGPLIYSLNTSGTEAWESATPTQPTPSSPGTPAGSAQRTAATINDANRWITGLATGEVLYNYQMYKFRITQSLSDIIRLNAKWIGYGEPTHYTGLFLWNKNTLAWEQLDSKQLGSDGTLSGTKTSNFSNYINGSADLYLLAQANYSLNTNYVELEVMASDSARPQGDCLICHAVHGNDSGSGVPFTKQLRMAEQNLCFGGGSGCHSDGNNSVQKININSRFTAGPNRTAHHSITAAEQTAGGTKVQCTNCHDPHLNNAANKLVNPDNRFTPYTLNDNGISNYISTSGEVYMLAEARHDGLPPVITSGPSVSNLTGTTATISWNTNEPSTSYVNYGITVGDYVYTAGNGTLVTSHTVNLTNLVIGEPHYRVRSKDALGNELITGDYTFRNSIPPPAPTLVAAPDINNSLLNATATLVWNPVTVPNGDPVEYYVELWSNQGSYASGWITGTSWTQAISSYDAVTWSWRVMARDGDNNVAQSGWSSTDTFIHTGEPPKIDSCPFIYVWNGKKFEYVSDMSGPVINLPKHIKVDIDKRNPYYLPLDNLVSDEDNQYQVKIRSTALGEIDILDQIGLALVDHPPGYEIVSSSAESYGPFMKDYPVIKKFYAISKNALPVKKAVDKHGKDVTRELSVLDSIPAPAERTNFAESSSYVLDFGPLEHPEYAKLVLDGWTFFKKEINVQSKDIPRVEVLNKKGQWEKVRNIGFISGDNKSMVVDLAGAFKTDDHRVRIFIGEKDRRFILDRARMDQSPPVPLKTKYIPAASADLYFRGPAKQIGPTFDHPVLAKDDIKEGDINYIFYGKFTKYGNVGELLAKTDDMFVIMQHGDEIQLKFDNPPLDKGLERSTVLMGDFYYKQTGQAKFDPKFKLPVEPLPFHGMSSYPYLDPEKYPDDAAHRKYREEWLTREYKLVDGTVIPVEAVPGKAAPVEKASSWDKLVEFLKSLLSKIVGIFSGKAEDRTLPTASTVNFKVAAMEPGKGEIIPRKKLLIPEKHYSLNGNYVNMMVNTMTGTGGDNVSDAWQSGGSTRPTPGSPGSPADATQKSYLNTNDANRWITDMVSTDGTYNYQMYKFAANSSGTNIRTLGIVWKGYGEPTPGYDVSLYLWNFTTSSWDRIANQAMGTENTISYYKSADLQSYCNKCHDNTPPAGVAMGSTRNIASTYASDFHGSAGGNGGLLAPYQNGMAPLSCGDCHDAHGSANVYHFRENLNGKTGKSVTDYNNNGQVTAYCQSCHAGGLENYHSACMSCHRDPEGHEPVPVVADFGRPCSSCHYHGAVFPAHDACTDHCQPGAYKAF